MNELLHDVGDELTWRDMVAVAVCCAGYLVISPVLCLKESVRALHTRINGMGKP